MYEIFEKLLKMHEITPYKVSKNTGIATSTFSDWKNGKSKPKQDKLQKIADYFKVPLEYLMTGEMPEAKEGYYLSDETAQTAQKIFENKELRLLFDTAKDAKPEDVKTVHDMLLALKRKERGDID